MDTQQPSADELDRARAFVAAARWTFASTLAEHPHEYVARSRLSAELQDEFDRLVALIYAAGYSGSFWQQRWRYLDIDKWAVWPSQSWYGPDAGKADTMLNRRLLTDGQLRLEVGP